jgi:hypothetical protein
MATSQTLVKAFEEAKAKILELYSPASSDPEIINVAAQNLAKNRYGHLIDLAIEQIQQKGMISSLLKAQFDISMRNEPDDHGLGEGRMIEYHRRFKEHIAPIMTAVRVAA